MRTSSFMFASAALALGLALCPFDVNADSGPVVPCNDCEGNPLFDAPSTGFWQNPEQPGVSLSLTAQNGLLLGAYYGYTNTGALQWYLFSGPLQRPEDAPHLLRVSAPLERYENGACLGCAYRPPQQILDSGTIVLEFDQRNHGTFAVDGGERTHIVPEVFGVPVSQEFSSVMHYDLSDPADAWVLTFWFQLPGWPAATGRAGTFTGEFQPKIVGDSFDADGVPYRVQWPFVADGDDGSTFTAAVLDCSREGSPPASAPTCQLEVHVYWDAFPELENISFPLPYANIGAGRIVSMDQRTSIKLEAFRLDFD